ncbi:MAG: hypothetical protein K0S06_4009 [Microvirga sp.]|jgi:hypothetical protein|nr:hypothetical protein [Microvirga sp.]
MTRRLRLPPLALLLLLLLQGDAAAAGPALAGDALTKRLAAALFYASLALAAR